MARERWKPVAVAGLAATAVALLGAINTKIGPWYVQLRKPAWQPPDWLFGPAWTLIFALTALAAVLYWRAQTSREQRLQVLCAFALNAFLNTLWSLLFFRLERPDWALYEVGFLWLSIALLVTLLSSVSRTAGWLLVPYLGWVGFAAVLNWRVVALNGAFTIHG